MTKTELKHQAQDELMTAMQTAFTALADQGKLTEGAREGNG